jgi:hypothetical protein
LCNILKLFFERWSSVNHRLKRNYLIILLYTFGELWLHQQFRNISEISLDWLLLKVGAVEKSLLGLDEVRIQDMYLDSRNSPSNADQVWPAWVVSPGSTQELLGYMISFLKHFSKEVFGYKAPARRRRDIWGLWREKRIHGRSDHAITRNRT